MTALHRLSPHRCSRRGLPLLALLLPLACAPALAQSTAAPVAAPPPRPQAAPAQPAAAAPVVTPTTGQVTIESDLQKADQLTGIVTATGNVRIVYPDRRVVATSRQAQYFSKEGRVVLSGDVDVIQEGGNHLRAEQVIYFVESERLLANPAQGRQVFSTLRIDTAPAATAPAAAAAPVTPAPAPAGMRPPSGAGRPTP